MTRPDVRWIFLSLLRALLPALLAAFIVLPVQAVTSRNRRPLPGARAIVVDERHSVLRERPDLRAPLRQRLSRGRVVGLLASVVNRKRERFYRISVSRQRTGWIYEAAIVRSGQPAGGRRLRALIDETTDDFARVYLARLCQREFRHHPVASEASAIVALTVERIAERLTSEIRRRIGDAAPARRRALFLNYRGLDRFNRIGITFDYDEPRDSLVVEGR